MVYHAVCLGRQVSERPHIPARDSMALVVPCSRRCACITAQHCIHFGALLSLILRMAEQVKSLRNSHHILAGKAMYCWHARSAAALSGRYLHSL